MLLIVSEEHHAEIEDDEDRNEYDLSGIPIATKRASISTFLHIVMGVPDTVTLPPLVDSEEIVQTYLDEAVDLMRCIANTNFDDHKDRIRQDLANVVEAVSMFSRACYVCCWLWYLIPHLCLATLYYITTERASSTEEQAVTR